MQYKLKHKTLAKIRNRNTMKIGKRFRKKRWRKRLMKERTMYILCLSVVVGFCTFKAFAAESGLISEPITGDELDAYIADVYAGLEKASQEIWSQ